MLEDLQHEMGLTYLFAAHDPSMVRYISTRIGVMYLGNLVEVAKSDNLYDRPLHPYTQALLSAIPIADPSCSKDKKAYQTAGRIAKPDGCAARLSFCTALSLCDRTMQNTASRTA